MADIPEGWQLVPTEPTPEMLIAAGTVDGFDAEAVQEADAAHIRWWKLMLSAAPPVQMEAVGKALERLQLVSAEIDNPYLSEAVDELAWSLSRASPVPSPAQEAAAYRTADDWLDEVENFSMRMERLLEEFGDLGPNALIWVRTAWKLGQASVSPVPSSERDDIIEMCAKWHDEVAATALEQAKSAESEGHQHIARHQYAVGGSHEASAAYFRSLKSQPAQEAE